MTPMFGEALLKSIKCFDSPKIDKVKHVVQYIFIFLRY